MYCMYAGAEVLSTVINGTGPIYLSDLRCNGNEMSLLECMRQDNQPTGLQSCGHDQDVSIQCRGTCGIHECMAPIIIMLLT